MIEQLKTIRAGLETATCYTMLGVDAHSVQTALTALAQLEAMVGEQEPVAKLHDDGYWTPMKTEAGRALNDRLMRAGSPSIDVYAAPVAQQRKTVTNDEQASAYMDARLWELIDMAGMWPKAKPDPRIWAHVMVYAPPAQQPQKLEDSEQYRMQMAGISTAAIGYWKEGDPIHPDYDTVALRDVAKLYAKYDALYKTQQPQYEAGDMASAHNDGFRAGVASVTQQPQSVDWEKLYRLEVKKKEALAAKYERDTGRKLTRIVPMAQQPQAKPDIHEAQGQIEFLDRKNNALSAAIRKVMARLADLLDEDQFKEIEETISSAGVQPQAEAVPAWTTEQITAVAQPIAVAIAENCRTAPQLVFPHLFLGLKDLLTGTAPKQAEAVPTEDTEAKVKRVEALLDDFMERDPDRAQRFIESQLAQIAVRKRLKAKQAEAVPSDVVQVFPAPHKTMWGEDMVCVDIELNQNETATVYFDKNALTLAEKRFSFVAANAAVMKKQGGGV